MSNADAPKLYNVLSSLYSTTAQNRRLYVAMNSAITGLLKHLGWPYEPTRVAYGTINASGLSRFGERFWIESNKQHAQCVLVLKLGEHPIECTVDLKLHFQYLPTGQVTLGFDGQSAAFTLDNQEPLIPVYDHIGKRVERSIREQIEKSS